MCLDGNLQSVIPGPTMTPLDGNEFESWDFLKVAPIPSSNSVAEFQRAGADQKVIERNCDPRSKRLRVDLPHQLRRFAGNGIDRHRGFFKSSSTQSDPRSPIRAATYFRKRAASIRCLSASIATLGCGTLRTS